jgi:hypothetical protein
MSTLTIEGKSLLTHFAKITMKEVELHVKELQEEGQMRAQNCRKMLYCITASVTETLMDKLSLKQHLYTLQIRDKPVNDGVLFLKVLIGSYYASTRYTTTEIRKQLAPLPIYMMSVAKGDVSKLCEHTRKLNLKPPCCTGESSKQEIQKLVRMQKGWIRPDGPSRSILPQPQR